MRRHAALLLLCGIATWARAEVASNVFTPYAAKVDAAVDRGLKYLASIQTDDGGFPGPYRKMAAMPGLCGMAFLSVGHLPGNGPYGENINKCVDRVLALQDPDTGYIGTHGGKMYSHNIATLLLLEVSGMVDEERQKKLEAAIPKAITLILSAQQVKKGASMQGGWRYSPTSRDSDLSCSGWALMALRSARLNGVPVPDKAIEEGVAYVRGKWDPKRHGFGYTSASARITLTGAGVLCLELTGHHGDEIMSKAGSYILNSFESLPKNRHFIYGLYYTSQGMFQLGGHYWERFAKWMYEYWLPQQTEDGGWPAKPGYKKSGGPYVTSMSILSFTVPYRQLPIYQRDETVDEEE